MRNEKSPGKGFLLKSRNPLQVSHQRSWNGGNSCDGKENSLLLINTHSYETQSLSAGWQCWTLYLCKLCRDYLQPVWDWHKAVSSWQDRLVPRDRITQTEPRVFTRCTTRCQSPDTSSRWGGTFAQGSSLYQPLYFTRVESFFAVWSLGVELLSW